jgi:hypothetical protein
MPMSRKVAEEMLPRLRQRYMGRGREGRQRMIDEICEQWGYSRKHAIKLLGAQVGWGGDPTVRKGRPPKYGADLEGGRTTVWQAIEGTAAGVVAALPSRVWRPFPRTPEGVWEVSAAQIDRLLAPRKAQAGYHGRCGTKPGGLLKTQIPIRIATFLSL